MNNSAERQAKFSIGQEFTTKEKHPKKCKVADIYKTYNAEGNLVKLRYVVKFEVAGQTITDYEVPEVTIVRSLLV